MKFLVIYFYYICIKRYRLWIGSGKELRFYFKSTGSGRYGRTELTYWVNKDEYVLR